MIKDRNGKEVFYVDKSCHRMLLRIKQKLLHEDQEFWMSFGGDTGTGKSLKAMQWGYIVNPGISINHICFDKDEFIKAVIDAKKGEVIICDEGISIFFSRGAMTKEGRLIAELIAQIRQKNLAVFLCIPDPLNLDASVRKKINVHVQVYESRREINGRKVTTKGNVLIYPNLPKKKHKDFFYNYLRIKNYNPRYSKKKPKARFREEGQPLGEGFKKPWYPVSEEKYRAKKESVLKKYIKSKDPAEVDKKQRRLDRTLYYLKELTGKSYMELSKLINIPKSTIKDSLYRYKDTGIGLSRTGG